MRLLVVEGAEDVLLRVEAVLVVADLEHGRREVGEQHAIALLDCHRELDARGSVGAACGEKGE